MNVRKEVLETVLRRQEKENSIFHVLSVDCEPGVDQGVNFSSDISRVKMRVVLGSGRITTRAVIIKKLPKLESLLEFLNEYQIFPTEIQLPFILLMAKEYVKVIPHHNTLLPESSFLVEIGFESLRMTSSKVYEEILPYFEELMGENEDPSEKLWCEVLAHKGHDVIVMQDLKELGYKNSRQKRSLDLRHALLTVRSLARFHAISAVLIHKGLLRTSRLQSYFLARNKEMMNHSIISQINILVSIIRSDWGKQWEEVANKLASFSKGVGDILEELWNEDTGELIVLNHGDCWTNNIMFRYNLGNEAPIGLRFVDYQESHYNTYSWDLTYFFHTSVSPELREQSYDLILTEYLQALLATFQFYQYIPQNLPSLDRIRAEMKRLSVFGAVVSAYILPAFMVPKDEALDLETLIDDDSKEARKMKARMLSSEEYTKCFKSDLNWCFSNSVFP